VLQRAHGLKVDRRQQRPGSVWTKTGWDGCGAWHGK
jgi:hypothetical protein